jgi:hypothetical protein
VEDDGIGFVPDTGAKTGAVVPNGNKIAKEKSGGLGQRIVRAMCEKLRANIEFDPKHLGTRALVSFCAQVGKSSPKPAK